MKLRSHKEQETLTGVKQDISPAFLPNPFSLKTLCFHYYRSSAFLFLMQRAFVPSPSLLAKRAHFVPNNI